MSPWLYAVLVATGCFFHPTAADQNLPDPDFETRLQKRRLSTKDDATSSETSRSFLGFPLSYHVAPIANKLESTVHCVGDDFGADAWMYRSCQFWNLCYNVDTQTFLYFTSREERDLELLLEEAGFAQSHLVAINSMTWSNNRASKRTKSISLGTIHSVADTLDNDNGSSSSHEQWWLPQIIADPAEQRALLAQGYYQLPDSVTFFPFVPSPLSFDAWRDCFAMYTVLAMFGLEHQLPVLLDYTSSDADGQSTFPSDLASIFGVQPDNLRTRHDATLTAIGEKHGAVEKNDPLSPIVCSPTGVAGLGMLAATHQLLPNSSNDDDDDDDEPPILTHTIGHGAALYEFRLYVLHNLGIQDRRSTAKMTVTLSYESPTDPNGWPQQLHNRLKPVLLNQRDLSLSVVDAPARTIHDLARTATRSLVYIAQADMAWTLVAATCLPRGSTLVLLDNNTENNEERPRAQSLRSERYVLDSAGYFRVHWIPWQPATAGAAALTAEALSKVVDIVQEALQHAQDS
jgi:hypothetical protein